MAKDSTIKLPEGVTVDKLDEYWNLAFSKYTRAFRRAQLLDAADRAKLWEALKAKFPKYQILADTNHVAYIKNNLMASIYTVGKSASVLPTTEEDVEVIQHLNIALDHVWHVGDVGNYQLKAGERAALMNMGITQVGWDKNISGGSGTAVYNGSVVFKNIEPTQFMRDPYSDSLDNAAYCITWDLLHKTVLKSNPLYAARMKVYEAEKSITQSTSNIDLNRDRPANSESQTSDDYCKLVIFWIRDGENIHEIHTIDNRFVLYVKEELKPAMFPFAILYCNEPAGDLIGTSEPAKIFSNSVAYNVINSCLLTAEYRNQRPPKFINTQSGLNISSFIEHGNDADYTFIVQGDAKNAVHYHEFPQPSNYAPTVLGMLNTDMQLVTGVDGRYTGRDTGSVLTTGGIEAMLDQVTLIDTPKVHNYEVYTKRLTQLVLSNMLEFSVKRRYFVKVPNTSKPETIEIDFPNIDEKTLFNYELNISTELPKNKARIAQTANTLMEKQMQYAQMGQEVELITPEEWLMMQDLPNRELMMERMGIQRNSDYVQKVMEVLTTYYEAVQSGVEPAQAVLETANIMQANNSPQGQYAPQEAVPETMMQQAEQGAVAAQGMPPEQPMMQGMPPQF